MNCFVSHVNQVTVRLTDRIAELNKVVSMLLTMNFGWAGTLVTGNVLILSILKDLLTRQLIIKIQHNAINGRKGDAFMRVGDKKYSQLCCRQRLIVIRFL